MELTLLALSILHVRDDRPGFREQYNVILSKCYAHDKAWTLICCYKQDISQVLILNNLMRFSS